MDPIISKVASQIGLSQPQLHRLLPSELTLWGGPLRGVLPHWGGWLHLRPVPGGPSGHILWASHLQEPNDTGQEQSFKELHHGSLQLDPSPAPAGTLLYSTLL